MLWLELSLLYLYGKDKARCRLMYEAEENESLAE